MKIADGQVQKNLNRAKEMIEGDTKRADLYLLPELFTSGYQFSTWDKAIEETAKALEELSTLAKDKECAIAGSILARSDEGQRRNRMFFIGKDGHLLAHYDKVHLFGLMNEDEHLSPGTEVKVFDYEGIRFGLAVCYDLRFPVQFYRMALLGAQVFLLCAEWPKVRRNILTTLSRARAMETQSYFVLCNRVGEGHDGTVFGGSSLISSPLGEGEEASATQECLLHGEISGELIEDTRSKIKVFDDRVADIDL